jgi:hypothetical protein
MLIHSGRLIVSTATYSSRQVEERPRFTRCAETHGGEERCGELVLAPEGQSRAQADQI